MTTSDDRIEWTEPQAPQKCRLLKAYYQTGETRPATPEDLSAAGYVPASDLACANAAAVRGAELLAAAESRATAAEQRVAEVDGLLAASHDETRAAERERDEARAEIVARSESIMRQAKTIDSFSAKLEAAQQHSPRGYVHRAMHDQIVGDLRAKLGEAENLIASQALLHGTATAAIKELRDKLARYAALESAAQTIAVEIRADRVNGISESTDVLLRAFVETVDALSAPAPGAAGAKPSLIMRGPKCDQCTGTPENCAYLNGGATPELFEGCEDFEQRPSTAAPNPETCGECGEFSGGMLCKLLKTNVSDGSRACNHFTRRLPVVAAARYAPCDDCCYDDGEGGCINADGDTANAACDAYKQEVVSTPRPAAQGVES